MKYIGNIVTDSRLEDTSLFNVVKDIKDIVDGIPTLVIGWEKVNKYFDNVKLLEWEIKDNIYWTFGKRERRNQMEKDLGRFKKLAMQKLSKHVKYVFLNVLTVDKGIKVRLYQTLKDDSLKTVYVANNVFYCCFHNNSKIIGLSLRDIEYSGGNVKNFFAVLYSNPNIKIVKDNENVPFEVRRSLKNNLYVIPYMYSE